MQSTTIPSEEDVLPEPGKILASTFRDVILPRVGAARREILVGPRSGVDVGVVDLGHGQVMAITTDPFFILPTLGWERAAWFAVNIVASDAVTSGLAPAYAAIDLNLPPTMSDPELEAMWAATDQACRDLDLAVVTGHTGRYDGCAYPMLGAMTVMCVGGKDRYLTPAMARIGDAVILTKGAAIETTAMFGATLPHVIQRELGQEVAGAAADLFCRMSVVKDALTAVQVGVRERGVTGMHDATERGVYGGLCEIAEAAEVGMVIDEASIPLPPEVRAVCSHFSVDPYITSSEGTLLATVRPHLAAEVVRRLAAEGIPAAHIGEITPADEGVRVVRNGGEEPLVAPSADPFWPAYAAAVEAAT